MYCKAPAESSDHSPPKCLLKWPPAAGAKILTLPACLRCNNATSRDESIVSTLLALVGNHSGLVEYRSVGGKVYRALERDASLRKVIEDCRNSQGSYTLIGSASDAFDRVMRKTAQGLYYGIYGRVPALSKFGLISIEHTLQTSAEEVVDRLRTPGVREISNEPLPEISERGLPNVRVVEVRVVNTKTGQPAVIPLVFQDLRQDPVEWTVYQPETVRFTVFQSAEGSAVCVMDLWDTLIVAVKAPWPSQRGALRKGRNNPNSRGKNTGTI